MKIIIKTKYILQLILIRVFHCLITSIKHYYIEKNSKKNDNFFLLHI